MLVAGKRHALIYLQSSKHVARRDAVDANAMLGPLNGQTGSEVPHSGLCCIVWGLRLRDIHNGARHAANHDDATRRLAFHEVFGNGDRVKVSAIHIDTPQFLDAIMGVGYRIKVLGKPSRGYEVVDLAMSFDNLSERLVYRVRTRDVAVMSGDLGQPFLVRMRSEQVT